MRIDLQSCRHSEMKNFCKWFSDGNCKLNIDGCKAPCEKYIDEVVEQLEEEREYSYADFNNYVNDCSPCLDVEYDDYFHRGIERAIKIVKAGGKE